MGDQEISETSPNLAYSKKGRLIVIALVAVIALGGIGFFYYSGIQTAKRTFAVKCAVITPKIFSSFSDYKESSNKPDLGLVETKSYAYYYIALKNSRDSLSAAAKENLKYSGAKKTLEALDSHNSDLILFSEIKEKELATEIVNPYSSLLQTNINGFMLELVIDPLSSRVDFYQRKALEADKLWESYMAKNFTSRDYKELNGAALKVEMDFVGLSNLCKAARG